MKLYEKLGAEQFLGLGLKERMVASVMQPISRDREDLVRMNAADRVYCTHLAATAFYLAEEPEKTRTYAKMCVASAEPFFFGIWRNEIKAPGGVPDPQWWHVNSAWMDMYEGVLLWASVLADWDVLHRISDYPDAVCRVDIDHTQQEKDLLVAIACAIKERADSAQRFLQAASTGPNESVKLIGKCVNSLLARDMTALVDDVAGYLKHYQKVDFPKPKLTNKISVYGSFLFHFARHRGLSVEIPAAFTDHIVKV